MFCRPGAALDIATPLVSAESAVKLAVGCHSVVEVRLALLTVAAYAVAAVLGLRQDRCSASLD